MYLLTFFDLVSNEYKVVEQGQKLNYSLVHIKDEKGVITLSKKK